MSVLLLIGSPADRPGRRSKKVAQISHKPRRIGTLLRKATPLKQLQVELDQQNTLLTTLRAELPDAVRPHLVAARLRDGELTLYADASTWVTRLRFYTPALLTAVRKVTPVRNGVRLRVHLPERRSPQPRRAQLTPGAAAVIAEAAETLADEDLRAALRRLADSRK